MYLLIFPVTRERERKWIEKMDNKNDNTDAMIIIPNEEEPKTMTEPTDDEILAAQGLLELSQVIRKFYDNIVSAFNLKPLSILMYSSWPSTIKS